MAQEKLKLFIIVSEDWSFWSHRLSLAMSAIDAGYDVTLFTKTSKYEDKIKAKGINVVNINFTRSSKSPFTDFINILKLARHIKKEKPDVIHNVALKTVLIGSIAAYFNKTTVVINAFTGLGYVFSSSQVKAKIIRIFIKPVFRFLMKKPNYWTIFQNPEDMKLFDESGMILSEQSRLIRGSGVDINEFKKSTDTNDIPVVMLASRMLWDKGVGEFVEAAKRVLEDKINVKFILVGNTDEDNPMSIPESIINEWVRKGYVVWKGHSDNMPETLSSVSIICLPSYREGLPKVLLEAAATGRPLIATDVPGCREIVKDGKNGILVKSQDVDSLYDAIKKLLSNKEMRQAMGESSRSIVESELSTDYINEQTLELYKVALNRLS